MDKPTVSRTGAASDSGKNLKLSLGLNLNEILTENRAKIYDFFSGESSGSRDFFSRDYLWPVWCCTVHVNLQQSPRNNIIENAVGRMLRVKHNDVKAVADSLCLDQDLVAFIAGRIKNGNAKSDHAELASETDDDEDVYNPRESMEKEKDSRNGEEEQTFYSIKMFWDAAGSGTLLPFAVPSDKMHSREIKQKTGDHITYALDNEGRETRRVRLIPRDPGSNAVFDNQEKLKNAVTYAGVLQRYLKKCAKNNSEGMLHLNEVTVEKFLRNPRVTPDLNPELAYIRVRIRMETSTFSLMVSDFTGKNYFRVLTDLVNKTGKGTVSMLSKKMQELKDEFYQELQGKSGKKGNEDSENLPPSVRMFKGAAEAYARIPLEIQGDADNEKYRDGLCSFFSSVYSSLENALYEVFRTYGNVPSQFGGEPDRAVISIILEKYGIKLIGDSDDISFIAGSTAYRISNISENHDMQTVIYLCLCQAAQNTDHPVIVLLQRFPDFVSNIRKIKGARDLVSHGSNDLKADAAVLKTVLKAVSAYLSQLVVGYKNYFTVKNAAPQLQNELMEDLPEMTEAARFRARYDLENKLGKSFVSELDPDLTSSLMSLFQHFDSLSSGGADTGLKKYRCLAEMYKILETVFSELVTECIFQSRTRIRDTGIREIRNFVTELTVEDDSHLFTIPKDGCLATARPEGVVKVLKGRGASLQASVLAFLYITPKEQLKSLRDLFEEYEFDMIGFLEKLIELRGHGPKPIEKGVNMKEFLRNFLFLFKVLKDS